MISSFQNGYFSFSMMLIALVVILGVTIGIAIRISINRKNREIRENIAYGNFIPYEDFERDWIAAKWKKQGLAGYKYNDGCGCYVIVVFDYPVVDNNYLNYENIYIGQSIHVCQRIHNHFNGRGNGDVYADIKYGKYVYVSIVPCYREEMNDLEKQLIRAFNATASYNNTRGGGKRW